MLRTHQTCAGPVIISPAFQANPEIGLQPGAFPTREAFQDSTPLTEPGINLNPTTVAPICPRTRLFLIFQRITAFLHFTGLADLIILFSRPEMSFS